MARRFKGLARRLLQRSRRIGRDSSGATLVEFAMISPVFLAMLFGILELGMVSIQAVNFHNAVAQVSRRIRTGQTDGPLTSASFISQVCGQMGNAADCASKITVRVKNFTTFAAAANDAKSLYATAVKNNGAIAKSADYAPGGANAIVLVTATYSCFLLVPFMEQAFVRSDPTHVLIADAVLFKSEPFGP